MKKITKGAIYYTELDLSIISKTITQVVKEDDVVFKITDCVVYANHKASKTEPNDVLTFNLDVGNDNYPMHFKGFLYRDGKINGRFYYSVDADQESELFTGIYKYFSKRKMAIYGVWRNFIATQKSILLTECNHVD